MAIVALCAQRARNAAHTREMAALTVLRKPWYSACSRPWTFTTNPQKPDGLCQSGILYPDPEHGVAGMLCASCTSCIGGSLIGMNPDIADVSCLGSAMWLTHQTYIFCLISMSFRSLFTDGGVGVEMKDETIVLYLWPAGV